MSEKKQNKLVVVKNENSPTGYYIHTKSGGAGIPATIFEVRLWDMYIEALDLAARLRKELERMSTINRDSLAKEETESEKKASE